MRGFFRIALVLSGLGLVVGSPARADLVDDFLGGNGTFSQPTWFDISPSFFGSMAWETDPINLTPNTDPHKLGANDFSGGLLVTRKRKIEAGVGPSFAFQGMPASITPFVGILPLVGVEADETRYVATQEAIKNLPTIRASILPAFLKTWRKGDHISYRVAGGVMFSAGLSYYGFGVAGNYIARGDWIVYVEKLDGDQAYVKITKTGLQQFGMAVGATIIGVAMDWFRNSDNYFSFDVDLNNPRAVQAFSKLLFGNLTEAQSIANEEGSPITLDTSARVEQIGRRARFWYGITSILGGENTTGKLTTFENEWHQKEGAHVQVYNGVNVKEKMSRVFMRMQREIEAFYGTIQLMTPDSNLHAEPFRNYSGSFFWNYENSRTKDADLEHAIDFLIRRTGMRQQLELAPPNQGKLKYTLTQFQLKLSKGATDALMDLARDDRDLALLDGSWQRDLDSYFDSGDPDHLCGHKSLSSCRSAFRDKTQKSVSDIKAALVDMARLVTTDPREFVRRYAEFGKAMIENRFTIQMIMHAVEGYPVEVGLHIEGSKVLNFTREIGLHREASERTRDDFIQWQIREMPTHH